MTINCILLLSTLLLVTLLCEVNAQPISTNISRIEIDKQEINESYRVFFQTGDTWLEAERTQTGFVVPGHLSPSEYLTVLITFGEERLSFTDLHISKFKTDWTIGIDKKPYSEEFVKPEDMEKTMAAYYIRFSSQTGLGTVMTVTIKKD